MEAVVLHFQEDKLTNVVDFKKGCFPRFSQKLIISIQIQAKGTLEGHFRGARLSIDFRSLEQTWATCNPLCPVRSVRFCRWHWIKHDMIRKKGKEREPSDSKAITLLEIECKHNASGYEIFKPTADTMMCVNDHRSIPYRCIERLQCFDHEKLTKIDWNY